MKKQYLGLGKTKYNSSVCLIDGEKVELLLTERLNRKKNSGAWPELALKYLDLSESNLMVGENRDVHHPKVIEETQNQLFPFYEYLKKENLDRFLSHPEIEFVTHHLCHAYAALALSPFDKSVILVMDGAGNEISPGEHEECSVFLQDGVSLSLVFQETIKFTKSKIHGDHTFGNRIGASYEKVSEFIFNSPHSSGKVMGLAPFSSAKAYENHMSFQESIPWEKRFKGKTKSEWEKCDHSVFKSLASSVQKKLEEDYEKLIVMIKSKFPDYDNLILTGGCALNCTNNARILYQGGFKKIYVPPFPGDECIGFGLAHYLKFKEEPDSWRVVPFEEQSAYFGAVKSIPEKEVILKEFTHEDYEVIFSDDICKVAADLLLKGETIAWFQGRSESGPRALGNRSILSRPDVPGLKDHLNKTIKFREDFRPYGCSVLHDKAHLYFQVEMGFDNPYMSYAIKLKNEFKDVLKEVGHVDGTSRMQTVRIGQNEKFYRLIKKFGDQSGLYCLLNTSLNIMDEPILETVSDARRFMDKNSMEYMVIGDFIIRKKK